MNSLDRLRRIQIVRFLTVSFIGLGIAYGLPQIIGLVLKIQSGDPEITPWQAAMASVPVRAVHIIGLLVTIASAIYVFALWSLRFTAPREGED